MEPINGVTLEKYAELCALMADTGTDETRQNQIAKDNDLKEEDWKAAKDGFTKRMMDPADMGKTAMAFMPLLAAAQDRLRGGKEPGSLEMYTKVHAEMAFRKDESGNKIDYMKVLEENGFTQPKWLEMENYWTPKVQPDPRPEFQAKFDATLSSKYKEMLQKESDRINGIVR